MEYDHWRAIWSAKPSAETFEKVLYLCPEHSDVRALLNSGAGMPA